MRAEKLFRKNPYKYADKLSSKATLPSGPTFSAETAKAFFTNTYRDTSRNATFPPLPGQPRPPPPLTPFNYLTPSLKTLQDIVKHKRNKAAPGLNGISYLPYKKCPSLLRRLHKIISRINAGGEVPEEWGCAYMILIAKDKCLDNPELFRNIAITNTSGKILHLPRQLPGSLPG